MSRMIEQIEIHLKYEGPDVENGTMALQDVIPVLQGISGAYSRLADTENPNITHRIKLSDVRQGSADIVLEIHQWLSDNSEQIGTVAGLTAIGGAVGGIAFPIIKRMFEVIRIKQHVGKDVSEERISAENSIVVSNSKNVEIVVSLQGYELHKSGKLDRDLERLTRPLQEGRIDSAEFEVQAANEETLRQRITSEDRPYFEVQDLEATTTTETELVAILNSLTKSTNSGYLYLQREKRVFYRYTGSDHLKLHSIFGNYNGPVKIRCRAKLDDQLEVLSLEIFEIDRMQLDMFDETSDPDPEQD